MRPRYIRLEVICLFGAAVLWATPEICSSAPDSLGVPLVTPGEILWKAMMFGYQRGAGPGKGQQCPMYPSCSNYAKEAISQHGLIVGVLMGIDRLNRCGHDLRNYGTYAPGGRVKSYDPTP